MSRIIFFRCRISEAREATVRQGLTEKNLTPWGAALFCSAARSKKMWDYFQVNPTWALSGAARTNFVPENSYTAATAVRQ